MKRTRRVAYGGGRAGHEDQAAEVGGALVAESAGGVDQSTNTVGLNGRPDERGSPGDAGRGGFLGLEELFLGVGLLGATVGVAKQWTHYSQAGGMIEDGAEGDGRRLDGWEV